MQLCSAITNETIRTRTKRSAALQRNKETGIYEKEQKQTEVQLLRAKRTRIYGKNKNKRSVALQRNGKPDYKNKSKNKERFSFSVQ